MFTRRQVMRATGLATLGLALIACGGPETSGEDLEGTATVMALPMDTPHIPDASRASARIAWDLLVSQEDTRTTNAAMSPSSLAVTLAILADGASGDSLASLDRTFGLAGDERSAAIGALRQALDGYEDLPSDVDADDPPETPIVHQANRVVILDDAQIKQKFLDRLSSYYGTGATRLPVSQATPNLDAWAKKHTAGLIEQSAIEIKPTTRLMTQDVVLFAARWRNEFDRDDVALAFSTGDGVVANIDDALGDTFTVPFSTGTGWRAVRLHYDEVLAMDVILPERGIHPSELDFDDVDASIESLAAADEQLVNVTMPPSDIESTWDLLEPLVAVGVDLKEMDGIFDGAITEQFAQQVRLTVTAKGTVGAALTEAAVGESAVEQVPAIDFIVDRPFIMRVLDTRTGWPLFVAVVNEPDASST